MSIDGNNLLIDLAERVQQAHGGMVAASREMAAQALETGRLLIEAKDACRHGEWLPFLERADIAERQAQRMMMLVRSELTSDTVTDLGIKASLDMASKRRLPAPGRMLIVAVGEISNTQSMLAFGEMSAYIFAPLDDPSLVHVLCWRDLPDGGADTFTTRRAMSANYPGVVFSIIDEFMNGRQAEMRFCIVGPDEELFQKAQALRDIVLSDSLDEASS